MQITNSWKEEGRIEGLAEGRNKGRNEGLVEGLLEGLETALELKFGPPARPMILRMRSYSLDALQELRRKLLDGAQLDEL